ncbi:hypothetical protein XELAEV_18013411mg [Xenopus laevis]|uniref:Uncharacterized protein n=1 Tax=Xenopus laevis TaxID=8355 RepID=A0A974DPL3_XENLA|nr:hypothetical protein XELAEV_18013411mg [Xenopus laevis]
MWLPMLVIIAMIFLYRWNRQRKRIENLSDKYVFITGCDSGFGNVLAKQLDKQGIQVLATCLTVKGAETLKSEASSRLRTVIMNVTDSQSVKSAAAWVTGIVGDAGLWGLVNNAGYGFVFSPSGWQKKEHFVKVLEINLLGMVDVTLNLLPLLRKAQGRIVNVSSNAGRLAFIGGGYCLSKFGVEAFSDSLRRELRDFGIKVSIIEPGAFRTGMGVSGPHVQFLEQLWKNLDPEAKESYGEEYYKQYYQNVECLTSKTCPELHKVTDCMEHALTAVHPWTRYSVGWDCKLFHLPLSYLPTVVSDYVLCRSAPKPALCAK